MQRGYRKKCFRRQLNVFVTDICAWLLFQSTVETISTVFQLKSDLQPFSAFFFSIDYLLLSLFKLRKTCLPTVA